MNNLPKIAIIGRPNVGKSSLFNTICKKRVSIVADFEGVTRDLVIEKTSFFEKDFILIDSGGIQEKGIDYSDEIEVQTEKAIQMADAILFVVDGKIGPTLVDQTIAKRILKSKKRAFLAVNKADNQNQNYIEEFLGFGIPEIFPISCTQTLGIEDLLERVLAGFSPSREMEEQQVDIAIIGRPNVGKSTLMNYLLQEERSIVGNEAGTTRDAVCEKFSFQHMQALLIDTAGIRRKRKEKSVMEKFASMRTLEAIKKAKLCLLVVDASCKLTVEDKKIASMVEKEGKGLIFLFNKWDLVKEVRMEHYLSLLYKEDPFLQNYPILFLSAKTGRNVEKIEREIQKVAAELGKKLSTSQINSCIEKAMRRYHPPMLLGKRLRIYYAVQIGSYPPRFTFFCNNPSLMTKTYQKYLSHEMRKSFGFLGAPLFLQMKGKKR